MNVRAYNYTTREYLYPTTNSISDLSTFFLGLALLEKIGNKITLQYGTGCLDVDKKEIFDKDQIALGSFANNHEDSGEYELAEIIFENGTFVAQNDEGLYLPLCDCPYDEDDEFIKIMETNTELNSLLNF